MAQPHLSLTVEIDVTHLMEDLKPQGVSLFNACLFGIMSAANHVAEFKTRFRDDGVIEHDILNASVTVPLEGDRFAFCEIDYSADWRTFNANCDAAIEIAKQQKELVENIKPGNDQWVFTSCLPWIKFSAMNNPLAGPDDCVPRVVWGKISQATDGRWSMPVVTEVHHALVDGIHMAKFFDHLESTLAKL